MIRKIIAGVFLLAIIFFLMPWVSVSCMGTSIVSVSGLDIVRGSYNVPSEYAGQTDTENEPLALYALIVAGAGLVLSLIPWSAAAILRALAGIAGVALLIALKFKLDGDAAGEDLGSMNGVLTLKYEIGYWLTVIAFAAAAILSFIRRKAA